ncbi:MAG TPA: T9SS type A sorting domain-containing protein [Ignavibacteria bacterium]|nr:T9SS type A sorting domain-containing protein [Ignavibacteria bacterium]
MKNVILSKKFFTALIIIFFASSVILFGNIDGRTGRTLKTSTSGCSCHGSVNTGVTVTIAGPDTVNTGQTQQFSLTVSNAGKTGMGLDVATRLGVLGVVTPGLHIANGELTHNDNITMTNGSVTVFFSYTAPGTGGTDTLWAVGLAGNSQSNTGGDAWNHAISKRIIVRSTVGIEPNISPADFKISENYPNPFNPSTNIDISLAKKTEVNIQIYDVSGSEIYTLANRTMNSGDHTFIWNAVTNSGSPVNSGVYFTKISIGGLITTKKMILIK